MNIHVPVLINTLSSQIVKLTIIKLKLLNLHQPCTNIYINGVQELIDRCMLIKTSMNESVIEINIDEIIQFLAINMNLIKSMIVLLELNIPII